MSEWMNAWALLHPGHSDPLVWLQTPTDKLLTSKSETPLWPFFFAPVLGPYRSWEVPSRFLPRTLNLVFVYLNASLFPLIRLFFLYFLYSSMKRPFSRSLSPKMEIILDSLLSCYFCYVCFKPALKPLCLVNPIHPSRLHSVITTSKEAFTERPSSPSLSVHYSAQLSQGVEASV